MDFIFVRFFLRLAFVLVPLAGAQEKARPDFSRVDQIIEQAVKEKQVAGGCVLVLHQGKEVYKRGFGFADIASKKPFTLDTPAVVASISKPLLATTAFRLQERGLVDMSDPISAALPAFAKAKLESGDRIPRAPTLVELFTHTGGLRGDSAPGGRPWFASWVRDKPLSDVVDRMAAEFPFKAAPGTKYAYSGIGTDVAARVLEIATEQPRNQLVVETLAQPLGMTNTTYRDEARLKKLPPMPTRYRLDKAGDLVVYRRPVPKKDHYNSSGGNIISTAPDLARWLLMIRNQGRHDGEAFLAADTVEQMLSAAPRSQNARGGLFRRRTAKDGKALLVGHTGSSGTNCWIDFERDVIGIMLTQTAGRDIKPFRVALEQRINACFPVID